jgi:hypothetical protein
MPKRPSRFHIESLEARQMMAGDVAAFLQDGNLFLNETAGQAGQANYVSITKLEGGQIRVKGLMKPDGTQTLVNNAAQQDFWVGGNLNVNFGGGSDRVVIDLPTAPTSGSWIKDINVNVAGPATQPANAPYAYYRWSSELPVYTFETPDDDHVAIWKGRINGSVNVQTGRGADYALVQNIAAQNVNVNTGSGGDEVKLNILPMGLNSIEIQTYASLAETDRDVVTVQHATMHGGMNVRLGGGNDEFYINNILSFWGSVGVDAGAGDDYGVMAGIQARDEILARLGDGNDYLSTDNMRAFGVSLLGDAGGNDRLYKTANVTAASTFTQTGWEYVNGIPQWSWQYDYVYGGALSGLKAAW